jgi:methylated-DNA-[protein]-cysteine S-methyltransferase
MEYQSKLKVPFGVLGIRCVHDELTGDALAGIDFLPPGELAQPGITRFAKIVCEQLLHYINAPNAQFSVPLKLNGTPYQQKVWQAMCNIPCGETRSYGELAAELNSAAQAVGQACGANPIPIIIPCHRVVGKAGLGGFMRHASGDSLDIKRWLLVLEEASIASSFGATSHSTRWASKSGLVAGFSYCGGSGRGK